MRIITRLNAGGPTKHVTWLSSGLSSKGCEHLLVAGNTGSDESDMSSFFYQNGAGQIIPINELKKKISIVADIKSVFLIYKLIQKYRPDVVHTHLSKAGLVGRLAVGLSRITSNIKPVTIHTYHGNTFSGYFGPIKNYCFLFLDRVLANLFTDRIIAISKQQFNELLKKYKLGNESQYNIINLGINFDFVNKINKDEARKKFNLNNYEKIFGIVGRLTEIKNHKLFINSIKMFLEENPKSNACFVIIGGGEKYYEDELKGLAGAEARIKFLGYIDDPALIYGIIDCLVLTSINEGTPLSILEAFSAEIPVIATNVGGVYDLLGDNERGFIVNKSEVEIIECFRKVLASDTSEIISRAKKFVIDNYSVNTLIENIYQLYSHALLLKRKCKD